MCIPTYLSHRDCSKPCRRIPHHQLDWKVGETNMSILESVLSFKPRVTSRDSGSYRGTVKRVLVPWDSIQNLKMSAKGWRHLKVLG